MKLAIGKLAILFAVMNGASGALHAAEISSGPSAWSGFHAGINGGWIDNGGRIGNAATDTGNSGFLPLMGIGILPASLSLGGSGFVGGGQIGYDWMTGPVVLGLEADFDKTGLDDETVISGPPQTSLRAIYHRKLDWLATFRGRIGMTMAPALLLYGTGGVAMGRTTIGASFFCPTCRPDPATEPATSDSSVNTSMGWTAGFGAEWKFAQRWSVKAEYLHVDLGRHGSFLTYTYPGAGITRVSTLLSTVRDQEDLVRFGLNYRF